LPDDESGNLDDKSPKETHCMTHTLRCVALACATVFGIAAMTSAQAAAPADHPTAVARALTHLHPASRTALAEPAPMTTPSKHAT